MTYEEMVALEHWPRFVMWYNGPQSDQRMLTPNPKFAYMAYSIVEPIVRAYWYQWGEQLDWKSYVVLPHNPNA